MTRRQLMVSLALACLTACSAPYGVAPAASLPPSFAGPSIVRSGSLTFTVFTAGRTPGFPDDAAAVDLAPDRDGYMWFTDWNTPAIGRIAPNGELTEFAAGLSPKARPYSIVVGNQGEMWFSDQRGIAVGNVTSDGKIVEHNARHLTKSRAMGIALDANGEPWVVGFGLEPLLGHLTSQQTIEPELLPNGMGPDGPLTADTAGNLWFLAANPKRRATLVERRVNGALRRTRLAMRSIALPCCPNKAAKSIVIAPNGDPWFTALNFGHDRSQERYLGTLHAGTVRLIVIRRKGLAELAYPSGLAATAKGLWITGGNPFGDNGALWHVKYNGKQTVYDLPYNPLSVAVDSKGNPWFTASFFGEPGRIVRVSGAR